MIYNKDRLIKFPVPFLKDKTVLFVDSRNSSSCHFMAIMWDLIQSRLDDIGYSFAFLPDLILHIHPNMLQYMFPGQVGTISVEDMYRRIQGLAGLDDRAGFLYKQGNSIHFRSVPDKSDKAVESVVDEFIEFLRESQEPETGGIRFSMTRPENSLEESSLYTSFPDELEDSIRFSLTTNEEPLDVNTQALIEAWEEFERRFGVTIQDLEIILGLPVKLSHLNITRTGKILLTDFERKEVRMDDLTKAIYFFYLRHPEGARLKELQDHEEEILKYYMGITGRDDVRKIRESVHNLLNPFGNGLNVSISRIKKAFKDIVGDRVARFYYVDGRYGEPRKIAVDRDLVIWEP